MKKLFFFASGDAQGGGSGFEKCAIACRNNILKAKITGVASNHPFGGVRERADRLEIPFIHFDGPSFTAEAYQKIAEKSGADFFALSGWLKKVKGLDLKTKFNSKTVFNIHPGPLPEFGGKGMYGHHVHEAVLAAFKRGEIEQSAVSMHFVTEDYDRGPTFLNLPVKIKKDDTAEDLGLRVNLFEHLYQPMITSMVVNGLISWDGVNPDSLKFLPGYYEQIHKLKVKNYLGEYMTLDTSDEACEKFGFHHGDIVLSKSNDFDKPTETNGNEEVILGVGKYKDGKKALLYTTYNARHYHTPVCWGGKEQNLLKAGFIKIA